MHLLIITSILYNLIFKSSSDFRILSWLGFLQFQKSIQYHLHLFIQGRSLFTLLLSSGVSYSFPQWLWPCGQHQHQQTQLVFTRCHLGKMTKLNFVQTCSISFILVQTRTVSFNLVQSHSISFNLSLVQSELNWSKFIFGLVFIALCSKVVCM